MESWLQVFVAVFSSVAASGGFWTWLQRRDKTRSATDRLLRGLAYDKIITNGMNFIERGWITKDELEEFLKYLFKPYQELGGNGVAERVVREVQQLPLKNNLVHTMMIRQARGNGETYGRHHRRYADEESDQRAAAQQ